MISENDKGLTKALVWTSMNDFSSDQGEVYIDRYFLALMDESPNRLFHNLILALTNRSKELGKDLMFLVEDSWLFPGDEPVIRIAWRPNPPHEAKS